MAAGSRTEVQLWVARLDQEPPVLAALSAGLTDDERLKASALPSEVRRRFIATRGILRDLLADRLDCAPGEVAVRRPPGGKPALASGADEDARLRFNLSHSDDLAVFALADGAEVGVDIERLRPLWNAQGLAARVMSAGERAVFEAAADPDEALLVRWTMKEAVLKGLGEGLTRAPASVVVGPGGWEHAQPVMIDGRRSAWSVRAFSPAAGYVGAVALDRSAFSVRLRTWMPTGC